MFDSVVKKVIAKVSPVSGDRSALTLVDNMLAFVVLPTTDGLVANVVGVDSVFCQPTDSKRVVSNQHLLVHLNILLFLDA